MDQLASSSVVAMLSQHFQTLLYSPSVSSVAVTTLVAGAIFLCVQLFRSWKYCRGKKVPPGSFGLPVVGESLSFVFQMFRNKAYLFTRTRRAKYGNIFKSHIFGQPYVIVSGPKAGRMMTVLEHKTFKAYQFHNANSLLGPRSVLVIHGDPHKRFRQLTNDAFSPEGLRRHLGKIELVARDVLGGWNVGQQYVVEHESTKYTFNIIAALVMSWMPGPVTEKAAALSRDVMHAMLRAPINLPGFAFYYGMKARGKLVKMFEEEIERRTVNKEKKDDILQTMLDGRDQQGGVLSKQDITDNLVAYIIGGHETSTATISFIVQFLNDHPNVMQQVRAEHEAIANAKEPNAPLTWEDYKKMVFTEKVIHEASRIASIVFWWHRSVAEDFEFEGYQIPKGWKIIFDLKGTHDLPEYFSEPYSFNPSRFDQPPKPYTFMPWGGGSRACLGMNLAKLEIAVFIHFLILKFRWQGNLPNLGFDYFGLPRPKGGVPITIKEKLL